jgi:hypothetical protein
MSDTKNNKPSKLPFKPNNYIDAGGLSINLKSLPTSVDKMAASPLKDNSASPSKNMK